MAFGSSLTFSHEAQLSTGQACGIRIPQPCAAVRSGFQAKSAGPALVAKKHNYPQVKPVVFESRSLVLRFVQVFWLNPRSSERATQFTCVGTLGLHSVHQLPTPLRCEAVGCTWPFDRIAMPNLS